MFLVCVQACFLELAPLIRFPQMGGGYLLDLVGKYRHMDPALEREALQFKIARPERQALLRDAATSHRRYHRRAGGRRPGEFQEFTWGVRLQDCRALPDGGVLTSAKWHVDGYLVSGQDTARLDILGSSRPIEWKAGFCVPSW